MHEFRIVQPYLQWFQDIMTYLILQLPFYKGLPHREDRLKLNNPQAFYDRLVDSQDQLVEIHRNIHLLARYGR